MDNILKNDNNIEEILMKLYISPDINKPYHFLYNHEESFKNWRKNLYKLLSREIEIFKKNDGLTIIKYYLTITDFDSSIPEKSYMYCNLMGKAFEEIVVFKINIVKKEFKLIGGVENETKTIQLSVNQELKIPIFIGNEGNTFIDEIQTPDSNNQGGYFLTNKGIRKHITHRIDKSSTWPKYKNKEGIYKLSINSIPLKFLSNSMPQYLSIDFDINYTKFKCIIDSKKSIAPFDLFILIAYLGEMSLDDVKDYLINRFVGDSESVETFNKFITLLYLNSKKILTNILIKFEEDNSKEDIEKYKISGYILKSLRNYYNSNITLQKTYGEEQKFFKNAINNLLPHIIGGRSEKALYLLNVMENFLIAIFQNDIYPNIDHFSRRRIATLGSTFEEVITYNINNLINNVKMSIENKIFSEDTLNRIKPKLKINNIFNNLFNMIDQKSNSVVKIIHAGNYFNSVTISNLCVSDGKKFINSLGAREQDYSSYPYLSLSDTPDHSENVALDRRLTIGVKISYMDFDVHRSLFENLKDFILTYTTDKKIYNKHGTYVIIVDESEHIITTVDNAFIMEFYKLLIEKKINNIFSTNLIDIALVPYYYKDRVKQIYLPSKKYRQLRINIGNRIPFLPYFIVEDGELLVDKLYKNNKKLIKDATSFSRLINSNKIVEYVGPEQKSYNNICESVKIFNSLSLDEKKKYNYVMFPSYINFGVIENMGVNILKEPGVRAIFLCSQLKQILMGPIQDLRNKFDAIKFLTPPYQRPCVTNIVSELTNINKNGIGSHAFIMFASGNNNIEDAVIINKSAVDNGFLSMISLNVVKAEIPAKQINIINPVFVNNSYDKLNFLGIPDIGTILERGDALYKNVKPMFVDDDEVSSTFDNSEEYIFIFPSEVERTYRVGTDTIIIKYLMSAIHRLAIGDKLTSRAAQKNTIGKIVESHNLPYDSNNLTPTIIFNGVSILGRKTLNMYDEIGLTNAFSLVPYNEEGNLEFINYPASSDVNLKDLRKYIYNRIKGEYNEKTEEELKNMVNCERVMYDPISQKPLDSNIYIAPLLINRLTQISNEKIMFRDRGKLNNLLKPNAGKKRQGSNRMGEMEIDNLIAHGCASILKEFSQDSSEVQVYSYICTECGSFATKEETDDYTRYRCDICEEQGLSPNLVRKLLTCAVKTMIQLLNFRGINMILEPKIEKTYY